MRSIFVSGVVLWSLWSWGCGGGGSPTGPSVTPPPAPPMPGLTVLRTATFQSSSGYTTKGGASIVRDGGAHRLDLNNDFQTNSSRGLDVRLCRETRCDDGDLNLGPLRQFSGSQSYALPNDGGAYAYVVIWCRGVSLPFGYGRLQ